MPYFLSVISLLFGLSSINFAPREPWHCMVKIGFLDTQGSPCIITAKANASSTGGILIYEGIAQNGAPLTPHEAAQLMTEFFYIGRNFHWRFHQHNKDGEQSVVLSFDLDDGVMRCATPYIIDDNVRAFFEALGCNEDNV